MGINTETRDIPVTGYCESLDRECTIKVTYSKYQPLGHPRPYARAIDYSCPNAFSCKSKSCPVFEKASNHQDWLSL